MEYEECKKSWHISRLVIKHLICKNVKHEPCEKSSLSTHAEPAVQASSDLRTEEDFV